MRTEAQVAEFRDSLSRIPCTKCDQTRYIGAQPCDCARRIAIEARAYEACIPYEFWHLKADGITHNREVFDEVVLPYCAVLNANLRSGRSIYFQGTNGAGKTTFGNYILMEVIRRRASQTCYYVMMTTIGSVLARSFADRAGMAAFENLLREVDWLFIDELLKERVRQADNQARVLFEDIVKSRYQDRKPVILASNATFDEIQLPADQGGYGKSIGSMLNGARYIPVMMSADADMRERTE